MITADQLVAHAIGDYVLQSDWMASKKRTEHTAALAHAIVYTLCFLPWLLHARSGPSAFQQTFVVCFSHFGIDRFGLARYLVWAKNFLAPRWILYATLEDQDRIKTLPWDRRADAVRQCVRRNYRWKDCDKTGYPPDRPPFLAVWLSIAADNILHVVINGLALRYL